jgi:hypothetical protein
MPLTSCAMLLQVLWNAYMSHVVNSASEDEPQPQAAEAQVREPVLSARKR